MSDLKEIIKLVIEKGWAVVPPIILVLIVIKPDRAEKLKELIFLPIFRLFKFGSKQYIASKINYTCTEFFRRNIFAMLPSFLPVKIRIKWVKSNEDAILKQDGTIVLCLRETNDQTRNILSATQIAIPKIVCPTVRPRIDKRANTAVDLVLLQRLAEGLGKQAQPVFQRYFLGPAIEETPGIKAVFQQLVELDKNGTFVTIFLEELNLLGDILFSNGDLSDKTGSFQGLLDYLLIEARREEHQEIPLDYFSADFRIGIIILAIKEKAKARGVTPYLNALDRHIKLGCDSIYVVAYHHAFNLLDRLLKAVEADERISFNKKVTVRAVGPGMQLDDPKRIALLRRNPMFSDTAFEEKVTSAGIIEGSTVEGTVIDLSNETAIIDILGMNAIIYRAECSWDTGKSCIDVLNQGLKKKFVIKSINPDRNLLELSLKLPDEDPWKLQKVPDVGEIINIKITRTGSGFLLGHIGIIEVAIPLDEMSWKTTLNPEMFLNTKQKIIITERNDDNHMLKGSLRKLNPDPWLEIQKNVPKGTELRANVIEINSSFVKVSLPGNLEGIIPAEAMQRAGFEYADYETTIVKGQSLDVVVTHVFSKKQKIRLDLKRNIDKKA